MFAFYQLLQMLPNKNPPCDIINWAVKLGKPTGKQIGGLVSFDL
jgi:hypothetical protein